MLCEALWNGVELEFSWGWILGIFFGLEILTFLRNRNVMVLSESSDVLLISFYKSMQLSLPVLLDLCPHLHRQLHQKFRRVISKHLHSCFRVHWCKQGNVFLKNIVYIISRLWNWLLSLLGSLLVLGRLLVVVLLSWLLLVGLVQLVYCVAVLCLVHIMRNLIDLELFGETVERLRVNAIVCQERLRKAKHGQNFTILAFVHRLNVELLRRLDLISSLSDQRDLWLFRNNCIRDLCNWILNRLLLGNHLVLRCFNLLLGFFCDLLL